MSCIDWQAIWLGLLQSKCINLYPFVAIAMCGNGSCDACDGFFISKSVMDFRLFNIRIVQSIWLLVSNQALLPRNDRRDIHSLLFGSYDYR